MTATNAPDTYAFFFANNTTMFVADATDGLQEWTLGSGTWSEVATLAGSYVGLTGVQNGNGTVSLYATTGTAAATGRVNGNSLISDTFSYTSGNSGGGTFGTPNTLITAGVDYGFAGVALAPQAPNVDLVVSSSSGSTTAGTPVTVTVTAQYTSGPDAGDTDTAYNGTIAMSSSDPNAHFSLISDSGGVSKYTTTLTTAGNQTVTATDASLGSYNTTVTVTPAALNKLALSAPVDATATQAFSVTVTAEDTYGNTIPSYTGTVSFSGGGTGAMLPSGSYTFTSGVGSGYDNGSHTFTNGVTLSAAAGSATGTSQTITVNDSVHSLTTNASVDDYVVSSFAANDFVVYRVGSGGGSGLGAESDPVYLDEYRAARGERQHGKYSPACRIGSDASSVEHWWESAFDRLGQCTLGGPVKPLPQQRVSGRHRLRHRDQLPRHRFGSDQHRGPPHRGDRRSDWQRQFHDRSDRFLVGR